MDSAFAVIDTPRSLADTAYGTLKREDVYKRQKKHSNILQEDEES